MKIIMKDCVYVQKNDLVHLWNHEQEILSSVVQKVFGDGVVIVNDSNRYEFVKFDDPNEIEYFKKLDWIIDYNAVKDLNKIGFVILGEEIALKMQNLDDKYNEMDEYEREHNLHIVDDYERCMYMLYSLKEILLFKQGKLKMILPDGVEYPKGYKEVNKEEKGLRRILSKFRKR